MREESEAAVLIDVDDPRRPDVTALIEIHFAFGNSLTPPDYAHALRVDDLCTPDITFLSARRGGELLGIGALRMIDDHHAEVKSMHTAAPARGTGLGARMIDHLVGLARSRGCRRVSLETGSMAGMAPARRLYARAGFAECGPFGGYPDSEFTTFMTLAL